MIEKRVEIHLLFLYPLFKEVVPKSVHLETE